MIDTHTYDLLLNHLNKNHIAIPYETREESIGVIADYLNEGLRCKQLYVYATVPYGNKCHLERFSSLIIEREENVRNGNLLFINLALFYISTLIGDMKAFEEIKRLFSEKIHDRIDKHV